MRQALIGGVTGGLLPRRWSTASAALLAISMTAARGVRFGNRVVRGILEERELQLVATRESVAVAERAVANVTDTIYGMMAA